MIPDCYDPACQEEHRQMELDRLCDNLPRCTICKKVLYPGDRYFQAYRHAVCVACKEELDDNEDIVELD